MSSILEISDIAPFTKTYASLKDKLLVNDQLEFEVRLWGIDKAKYDRVLEHYSSLNIPTTESRIEDYSINEPGNAQSSIRKSFITTEDVKELEVDIRKEHICSAKLESWNIKVVLSKETKLEKGVSTFTPGKDAYRRTKNRISFLLDDQVTRLDITMVTNRTGTVYEIELELLAEVEIVEENIEKLNRSLYQVISIVEDSDIPSTKDERNSVKNFYNSLVDLSSGSIANKNADSLVYHPLVQARNLKINDLKWSEIVERGSSGKKRSLTLKAEGIRKQLVVHFETGIWLLHPRREYCLLIRTSDLPSEKQALLKKYSGYIFDGEDCRQEHRKRVDDWLKSVTAKYSIETIYKTLFQNSSLSSEDSMLEQLKRLFSVKHLFIPFDTISTPNSIESFKSESNVKHIQLSSRNLRVGHFTSITSLFSNIDIRDRFLFLFKRFLVFNTPEGLFESFRTLFEIDNILFPFQQDGVVCTPEDDAYNTMAIGKREKLPALRERKLSKIPQVCKWKRWNDLTIDLVYADAGTKFRSKNHQTNTLVDFVGSPKFPFDPTINIDTEALKLFCLENGVENNITVIEFAPKRENGTVLLSPRMIRHNKDGNPNNNEVAIDIWEDIHVPLMEATLRGENSFQMLFRYHNLIKTELYDRIPIAKFDYDCVDIGSGQGGDITKWKNIRRIVAVEPNAKHIEEFKSRMEKHRKTNNTQQNLDRYSPFRIGLLQAGGEESEKITEFATKHLEWSKGNAKPLVISMMLSLSFFYRDVETFQSLVRTINMLVERHRASGGTQVHFIYLTIDGDSTAKFFNHYNTRQKSLGPATLSIDEKNVVSIHIEDSIVTNQTEYLVNIDDLRKEIRFIDLFQGRASDIQNENQPILNIDEANFTQLYTYGHFMMTHNCGNAELIEKPERVEISLRNVGTGVDSLVPTFPSLTLSDAKARDDDAPIPYSSNLYRIPCIQSENSSLYHAIMKATSSSYQNEMSMKTRTLMVEEFRKGLAALLTDPNPLLNFRSNEKSQISTSLFSTAGNSEFVKICKTLENAKAWLTENYMIDPSNLSWLPFMLKCNFVVRCTKGRCYTLRYPQENTYPWIFLLYIETENSGGYEVLGVPHSEGLGVCTIFAYNDPNLAAIVAQL